MAQKSFDYGLENLTAPDAGTCRLVLEHAADHQHMVLYHIESGELLAAESFGGAVHGEQAWYNLARSSKLLQFRDVPLLLMSAGLRALPVPQHIFSTEEATMQLNALQPTALAQRSFAAEVPAHRLVWFYQVSEAAARFAEENFRQVTFAHVMARMLNHAKENNFASLLIYPNYAWLTLIADGSLRYAWHLPVTSPDDLVYRILYVCQQFALDYKNLNWQVGGLFEENGALYQTLRKFIPNILPAHYNHGVNDNFPVPPHYLGHTKMLSV